jgi:hypothetical protein
METFLYKGLYMFKAIPCLVSSHILTSSPQHYYSLFVRFSMPSFAVFMVATSVPAFKTLELQKI